MRSQYQIQKNIIFLGAVQVINYLMPFIIIPVLLNKIGIEQYGKVSMAMGVILVVFSISEFGFNITGPRLISTAKNNREESFIVSSLINARLLLLVPCLLFLIGLILTVPNYQEEAKLIVFSFMIVLGQAFTPNWFYIGKEKNQYQSFFHFLSRFFYFVAVWFLINSPDDYYYVNFWNGVGLFLVGIVAIVLIFKKYRYRVFIIPVKKSLIFIGDNFNIFFANFLSSIHRNAPIIIAGFMLTSENLGLYSVLDKVILAIISAFIVLYNALYPRICSLYVKKNGISKVRMFFEKYLPWLGLLVIVSAIVFVLVGSDLIGILSREIDPLNIQFEILLIGFIPIGLFLNLPISLIIVSFNIQRLYLIYSAISALTIIVLGITLGFFLGLKGLIIAIFITELISGLIGIVLLKNHFKITPQ
ncbi:MAG: oligosaccharide flippase family protein [Cyclobacteriaceae bacterium]